MKIFPPRHSDPFGGRCPLCQSFSGYLVLEEQLLMVCLHHRLWWNPSGGPREDNLLSLLAFQVEHRDELGDTFHPISMIHVWHDVSYVADRLCRSVPDPYLLPVPLMK